MNKLLILIVGIFFLSFASAQVQSIGQITQNECGILTQTCDNCTFVNITKVVRLGKNSIIFNIDDVMTKDGTFYNYSFCNTSIIGNYLYSTVGDLDGIDTVSNVNFEITSFGTKISNSGIVYSVLMLIIFGMDILVFFLIYSLGKHENFKDDEGNFVGVSLKKYIRVVLIGISYGLILLTLNLMNAAATATLEVTQFAGILGGIFLLMLNGSWVWTISIVIWMGIMIWKDGSLIKEVQKRINEAEHALP